MNTAPLFKFFPAHHTAVETPGPILNPEAKHSRADDTRRETSRESKSWAGSFINTPQKIATRFCIIQKTTRIIDVNRSPRLNDDRDV